MPAIKGTIRVISAIDADDNIRALFVDTNDRLVVNQDLRSQLAIDGASHIYKGGVITNTSSILYTVPAGKTWYLTDVSLSGHNGDAAVQSGYLYVYDGDNTFICGWKLSCGPSQGGGFHVPLRIPIAMPETWYVKGNSPDADFAIVVYVGGLLV